MPKPEGYVSADYLRRAAELGKAFKTRTYELMQLAPGQRVLDVGCGPGLDTVPLAERVGPAGHVTGVDTDEDMLRQADELARERGVANRILHRRADAGALPFADASFDACRAERLLQVLPSTVDPATIVAELVRVTRPGGFVVLADADWATASVDFSDAALERRLLALFAERLRPNGFAGRQLYRLLRRAGLEELVVDIIPMVHADLSQSPYGEWLPKEALAAGVATTTEAERWRSELREREQRGEYFSSVSMVIVAGRRVK